MLLDMLEIVQVEMGEELPADLANTIIATAIKMSQATQMVAPLNQPL